MTARDVLILRDLWLFRYATTQQVARLHFGGHAKVAQRRLRVLHKRGFVRRFRPGLESGFRQLWYQLSPRGAKIIEEREGLSLGSLLTRTPRTQSFLAHHALVSECRMWLREGCERARGTFSYKLVPAYEEVRDQSTRSRRIALVIEGHRRMLIPDAAFTLTHKDTSALFLLEADRATEPLRGRHQSSISSKLRRYRSAYDQGTSQEHYGQLFQEPLRGFRVLFVVPTQRRQQRIVELAEKLDLAPLVWVTTHDSIERSGNLDSRVWAATTDSPLHCLAE